MKTTKKKIFFKKVSVSQSFHNKTLKVNFNNNTPWFYSIINGNELMVFNCLHICFHWGWRYFLPLNLLNWSKSAHHSLLSSNTVPASFSPSSLHLLSVLFLENVSIFYCLKRIDSLNPDLQNDNCFIRFQFFEVSQICAHFKVYGETSQRSFHKTPATKSAK